MKHLGQDPDCPWQMWLQWHYPEVNMLASREESGRQDIGWSVALNWECSSEA